MRRFTLGLAILVVVLPFFVSLAIQSGLGGFVQVPKGLGSWIPA